MATRMRMWDYSVYRSSRLAVSRGVIPRGRWDAPAWPGRMICCGAPPDRKANLMASTAHHPYFGGRPALRARWVRGRQAGVLARRRPHHGTAVVAGTGRRARRPPRRPFQLASAPGRPESGQARSPAGQDHDRAGARRLRRSARPGRLDAAEGLGPPPGHLPRAGGGHLPTGHWHWDNPCELHLDRPRALFVVSFIGSVEPRGGGTLILSGSPRLLIQQERAASREPAARIDRDAQGTVPSLPPVADGAHRDRRRHRRTGPPPSWTGRPSSTACRCAWSS